MKYFDFSEKEKAEAFDKISKLFFDRNFGQATKSEIELVMFDIYIEKMIEDAKDDGGLLDYSKCSDYRVGKELGIPNQRVRNLKIKKQLVYPIEFDWKKSFASLLKNARYDQNTHMITLGIPDPNLYIEIQNFIEETGGFIEKQLSSNVLKIRAEYFIEIVVLAEDSESQKNIIESIKKQISEHEKGNTVFDEKNIGKSILSASINITTLVANIASIASGTGPLWSVLNALMG